jgi:TonB family protein
VVVRVEVDEGGRPRNPVLAGPSVCPDLDRAALEAVRKARFRPAREWGKPVAVEITVPVDFEFHAAARRA